MTPPKQVLLIDDDSTVDYLFAALLEEMDHPLPYEFKTNGEEALAYLADCHRGKTFPDLIIVDLKMPVMDGLEFLEKYQEVFLPGYPATKVLVLTSSFSSKDKTLIQRYEFVQGFLTKPLESEMLQKLLPA